ncbi:thiamine biosynthesis protein ApbE [Pseudoxanthomonas kalamensis DSM 18571]|uniref:FAD:protein FMN transferase n=1 Tax=Pseudoxanthomonas kalamensis TaxID=289483 RepID=UPI0013919F8D|nr:FAD:protein FMN transferase [Pseudoxanthomonas kalamensis]KAF1711520.1 thiamine biosynthesis protein ApbE [Pseudoxanthomonas kalamensis DSM 18571]
MGTRWRVNLCANARAPLETLHAAIQGELDTVVAQMSTWVADSDISRYNRAEAGNWQTLPAAFARVLAAALQVAADSDGAYDPTLGSLVAAWGFGAEGGEQRVPDTESLMQARARVGWRRLQFDGARLLQPGGVALDLSAIAKGYGVDAVVAMLRARGIEAALVDVGGELRGYGRKPDGTPWRVLVEHRDDDDAEPCVLQLDNAAVATSGDRWHRFVADGREYSHTLDPRSGRPVDTAPAAVTVVAESAMLADAWATALTVMGLEHGPAFAEARGLAARFVDHRPHGGVAEIRSTTAFDRFLPA